MRLLTRGYREEAEARKREAAAKKAAREAELAAEESSIKTVKVNPKAGKNNPAAKPKPKVGGLDAALGAFESDSKGPSTISASGIDDALDALSLAHGHKVEVDRHPERRYKAAYAAYEEKRLPELKIEQRGLRQNQMKELIRKEFEKHPDNPFNQAGIVAYNANRDEVSEIRKAEMERLEKRLGR